MSRDHFRRSISRDTNVEVSALSIVTQLSTNDTDVLKQIFFHFIQDSCRWCLSRSCDKETQINHEMIKDNCRQTH